MKMMMVQSLVVMTGCGTPLWCRGGKGGVVGGEGVVDRDRGRNMDTDRSLDILLIDNRY